MSKLIRARQFLSFDALRGHKEALKQKEKIIVDKKELSEDDAKILNYKLSQIKVGMLIKLVYYCDKEYIQLEGMVSKLNQEERYFFIVKTKVSFDDIVFIDGFDDYQYVQ